MEISKETIMRAWKDESFRSSLSPDEQQAIPDRPMAADGPSSAMPSSRPLPARAPR